MTAITLPAPRDAAHDIVNFLEDLVERASPVDWVLAALACFALFWLWLSLRASTRVGPVEVEALTHDGEDEVALLALTGALREKLSRIGLPSPLSVPAGAPQAELIATVEASGAPQAAFLGKLLQVMPRPRPREYKVSGVLLGVEQTSPHPWTQMAGNDDPPGDGPCGLSFWVRPAREGTAHMETVKHRWVHSEAVDSAAFQIYRHISNDAEGAFPIWARWTSDEALRCYVIGCRGRYGAQTTDSAKPDAQVKGAANWLQAAADLEPFNVLADLELANLFETSMPDEVGFARAQRQASILRRYLEIARAWPGLVEPRYRASIVAGALATTCKGLSEKEAMEVAREAGAGQGPLRICLRTSATSRRGNPRRCFRCSGRGTRCSATRSSARTSNRRGCDGAS